jgi:SOS-response transcriptional repressor LexA
MSDLTKRQRSVLEFIDQYAREHGYPPSVRDICRGLGLSSSATVHSHLRTLERKGYLTREPSRPRAIEVHYDSESGAVRLLSRIDEFSRYLATEDDEFPWQLLYLVLTIAGLAFYLAVWIGFLGFVSQTLAAVAIIAVFGVAAAVHYVMERQSEWRLPLTYRRGE